MCPILNSTYKIWSKKFQKQQYGPLTTCTPTEVFSVVLIPAWSVLLVSDSPPQQVKLHTILRSGPIREKGEQEDHSSAGLHIVPPKKKPAFFFSNHQKDILKHFLTSTDYFSIDLLKYNTIDYL